jgi:hypothetical protein
MTAHSSFYDQEPAAGRPAVVEPAAQQLRFGAMETKWERRFNEWVHTPHGRMAANRFIRLAYRCHRRNVKMGAKAIWERMRWDFMLFQKASNEAYKLNNNYVAYMARFAMEREPSLRGFFELREVGD